MLTCLGSRLSAGEGYEAAVTAIARCGWVKLRGLSEFLCGRMFPLELKAVAYGSNEGKLFCAEVLNGTNESKMGIF